MSYQKMVVLFAALFAVMVGAGCAHTFDRSPSLDVDVNYRTSEVILRIWPADSQVDLFEAAYIKLTPGVNSQGEHVMFESQAPLYYGASVNDWDSETRRIKLSYGPYNEPLQEDRRLLIRVQVSNYLRFPGRPEGGTWEFCGGNKVRRTAMME